MKITIKQVDFDFKVNGQTILISYHPNTTGGGYLVYGVLVGIDIQPKALGTERYCTIGRAKESVKKYFNK